MRILNLKYNKKKMPEEKHGYKMHMIVPKPTDPEKLKKREELSKRLKEYPNEELKKALEWIQAKKEQEEREKREQEERERKEEERKAREKIEKEYWKVEAPNRALNGDKAEVLYEIEDKGYIKSENAEYFGYKGKCVTINLPAIGNFQWFKYKYFVSDDWVDSEEFELKHPEYIDKSNSLDDMVNILTAIRRYLSARWVYIDKNMEYERKFSSYTEAWTILKNVKASCLGNWNTEENRFWLKDKEYNSRRDRTEQRYYLTVKYDYIFPFWHIIDFDDYFRGRWAWYNHWWFRAHLFLKLSD